MLLKYSEILLRRAVIPLAWNFGYTGTGCGGVLMPNWNNIVADYAHFVYERPKAQDMLELENVVVPVKWKGATLPLNIDRWVLYLIHDNFISVEQAHAAAMDLIATSKDIQTGRVPCSSNTKTYPTSSTV